MGAGGYFGWSVDGVGDVDGDGYDDVVIGGAGDDNGSRAGAWLFRGGYRGLTHAFAQHGCDRG